MLVLCIEKFSLKSHAPVTCIPLPDFSFFVLCNVLNSGLFDFSHTGGVGPFVDLWVSLIQTHA